MNTLSFKLLGAVAVAGLVAAGGTAFTAMGVTSEAGAAQAVGIGTVSQTIDGPALSSVDYTIGGERATDSIDGVVLTFGVPLQAGSVVELDALASGAVSIEANIACATSNQTVYTCTLALPTSDLAKIDVTVS